MTRHSAISMISYRQALKYITISLAVVGMQACERHTAAGGDRDKHGCIGSAGYLWCAKTQSCERPWVLARHAGFADEPIAFSKYCSQPSAD